MTWLRPPTLVLAAFLIVGSGVLLRAVAQSESPPATPAQFAGSQPAPAAPASRAASAPASQAAKNKQLQVPEPTVVLNPGEVPAISFTEPKYDFGRVLSGTEITHEFEFTNTGNGPLEILQVRPG